MSVILIHLHVESKLLIITDKRLIFKHFKEMGTYPIFLTLSKNRWTWHRHCSPICCNPDTSLDTLKCLRILIKLMLSSLLKIKNRMKLLCRSLNSWSNCNRKVLRMQQKSTLKSNLLRLCQWPWGSKERKINLSMLWNHSTLRGMSNPNTSYQAFCNGPNFNHQVLKVTLSQIMSLLTCPSSNYKMEFSLEI